MFGNTVHNLRDTLRPQCTVMFQVKYYRDTYAEHPEDRENIEYCVQMEGQDALLTLNELYDQMKGLGFDLSYFR